MADRTLTITWRNPVRGREEQALEAFGEAMGMLGRFQQEGRIESFDVTLNAPNELIDGYVTIRGSSDQIGSLRADAEFMRSTANAQLAVEGINHIDGYCNEGVAELMALYQEAIGRIAQPH